MKCRTLLTAQLTFIRSLSICMQNSCWLYFIFLLFTFCSKICIFEMKKKYDQNIRIRSFAAWLSPIVNTVCVWIINACIWHWWFTVFVHILRIRCHPYTTSHAYLQTAATRTRGNRNFVFSSFWSRIQYLGFSCSKFFTKRKQFERNNNKNHSRNCHLSCFVCECVSVELHAHRVTSTGLVTLQIALKCDNLEWRFDFFFQNSIHRIEHFCKQTNAIKSMSILSPMEYGIDFNFTSTN